MEPRAHRWEANGLSHSVLEWGATEEASRPTAVLVHGFQDAAATWDDVASLLASRAGLRVLVPDMRGFGDGPRVPSGAYYYFPDYVADVAAIVRGHVAAEAPLLIVGHSMGATVSTYFAGAFPDRVTKLALIDGLGPPDYPHDAAPHRMQAWIEGVPRARAARPTVFPSVEAAAQRLARHNPDVSEEILQRRAAQLLRREGDGFAWRHDPLHATVSPILFFAESYKAYLRRITCPALYVSGGPKGFHVPDEDERLACISRLTRVTIDGGHALHWTRPEELGDALVRFWST